MARFALRIKSKTGQQIVEGLTTHSTILDLKNQIASLTNIPVENLHVLNGYPPKTLNLSDDSVTLESSGISSGDTLIVEEQASESTSAQPPRKAHISERQLDCPGILMKQVVPADNSCLFTSIGFVLSGKVDTTVAPSMREIIAEVVSKDTDAYSEAILGKPNDEYCRWILKSDSWGGAIELAVLSNYYGIEMAVVDTLNAIINRFGEDQRYAHRVFLLFDGIHYDPLYLEPLEVSFCGFNLKNCFFVRLFLLF